MRCLPLLLLLACADLTAEPDFAEKACKAASAPLPVEASGLLPRAAGGFWISAPESNTLWGVSEAGEALGELRLPVGADAFADLAAGPCPGGSGRCIWVADMGQRESVEVYATPELGDGRAERVWRFAFRLRAGQRVEAMVVARGRFHLIDTEGRIWAPKEQPEANAWLGTLDSAGWIWVPRGERVRGADLREDGRLVVRTERSLIEYPPKGAGWGDGTRISQAPGGGGVAYVDRALWVAGAALDALSCGPAPPPPRPAPEPCRRFSNPLTTGHLDRGSIDETSGIVESRRAPGHFWLHNDSGDSARLFATDPRGTDHGTLSWEGSAMDFEDIAAAPCPDGSGPCLWVGDIGDNGSRYDTRRIYVLPEPDPRGDLPHYNRDEMWRYTFRYPDGARDAEALVVDPDGRRFAIIEKRSADTAKIYLSPELDDEDAEFTLRNIGRIDTPEGKVTGADLGPHGLLVRSYSSTRLYRATRIRDMPDAEHHWVGGSANERQAEAVAWDAEGDFWTVSEDRNAALHHAECQ